MYENLYEAFICIYKTVTSMGLSVSEMEFHRTQVFFSGFRNSVTVTKSGDNSLRFMTAVWNCFREL